MFLSVIALIFFIISDVLPVIFIYFAGLTPLFIFVRDCTRLWSICSIVSLVSFVGSSFTRFFAFNYVSTFLVVSLFPFIFVALRNCLLFFPFIFVLGVSFIFSVVPFIFFVFVCHPDYPHCCPSFHSFSTFLLVISLLFIILVIFSSCFLF